MSVAVPWLAASAAAFAVIRTRTPPARRRAFDRALLARAGRSVPPDLFVAPEELASARATRPIGRVWVPYGRVGFGAAPTEADIVKWLGEGLELTRIEAFGRSVRLARFDLSARQGGSPPPPDAAGPALEAP